MAPRRTWIAMGLLGSLVTYGLCGDGSPPAEPGVSSRVPRTRPSRRRSWLPRITYYVPPGPTSALEGAGLWAPDAGADELDPAMGASVGELSARLCAPLARARCLARDVCGCGAPAEPNCIEQERADCEDWVQCSYGWVEDDEHLSEARLSHCVAAARSRLSQCDERGLSEDCYDLFLYDSDCEEEADGEPCGDGICRGGRCLDGPAPRTGLQVGEACEELECGRHLACVDGRCAREACWSTDMCLASEACVDNVCVAPEGVGGPCEYDEHCAPSLACVDEICSRVERCSSYEDCGRDMRCAGETVARCQAVPSDRVCYGSYQCGNAAVCQRGRCVPAPAVGEPCPERRCEAGAVCRFRRGHQEGETPRCTSAPVAQLGEACDPLESACGRDLVCARAGDDGVDRCARPAAIGERCGELGCAPGAECVDLIDAGRCEPTVCGPSSIWLCDVD